MVPEERQYGKDMELLGSPTGKSKDGLSILLSTYPSIFLMLEVPYRFLIAIEPHALSLSTCNPYTAPSHSQFHLILNTSHSHPHPDCRVDLPTADRVARQLFHDIATNRSSSLKRFQRSLIATLSQHVPPVSTRERHAVKVASPMKAHAGVRW